MKSLEPISNFCSNLIKELIDNKTSANKICTGFKEIDKMVDALHGGELIFVCAHPGMGKASFTINIACHIAQQFELDNKKENHKEKIIAYFSLEATNKDIVSYILSYKCNIPLYNIRHNSIRNYRKDLLAGEYSLKNFPFYINDLALDLDGIKENLVSLQEKNKTIGLIVIDNLQALENGVRAKGDNVSLSGVIYALKGIAKEFNVPILINSGLERKIEKRISPRPMLTDLPQEETEIADVVMFLYRESYYLSNTFLKKHRKESYKEFALREAKLQQKKAETRNKIEVIIAKNHGATGKVILWWNPMYVRFKDIKD